MTADAARQKAAERLSLNDRLGLIGLIDEGLREGTLEAPALSDLFGDLWHLVARTARGCRIDRLPAGGKRLPRFRDLVGIR